MDNSGSVSNSSFFVIFIFQISPYDCKWNLRGVSNKARRDYVINTILKPLGIKHEGKEQEVKQLPYYMRKQLKIKPKQKGKKKKKNL